MAAVRYRLRAEWRTRWRAALALGLVANAVAFVPGRIAARLRPATILRSE